MPGAGLWHTWLLAAERTPGPRCFLGLLTGHVTVTRPRLGTHASELSVCVHWALRPPAPVTGLTDVGADGSWEPGRMPLALQVHEWRPRRSLRLLCGWPSLMGPSLALLSFGPRATPPQPQA